MAGRCRVPVSPILVDAPIEPGAQAVLLDPGTVRLQRPVALFVRDDLPNDIDQDRALGAIRALLEGGDRTFAPLAQEGEAVAFQVVVTEARQHEIWDAAGSPLETQGARLSIDDASAPKTLVSRLVHMAEFRNVQELDNNVLPLEASIPQGYDRVTDVLKVLATKSTTNFRWLELPELGQPENERSSATRGLKSALDGSLDALVEQQPRTRTVSTGMYTTDEWTVGQVELRIEEDTK